VHPSDVAALIIEPVLGEGGFLTPPPGFMAALRALADKHGMLLIADEVRGVRRAHRVQLHLVACGGRCTRMHMPMRTRAASPARGQGSACTHTHTHIHTHTHTCTRTQVQSGAGRTGRWWGHQHFAGMDPDMLIFAKGIASGYPLAGALMLSVCVYVCVCVCMCVCVSALWRRCALTSPVFLLAAPSHVITGVATRDADFDNMAPGTMGGTYGGNAVACAAAIATIQVRGVCCAPHTCMCVVARGSRAVCCGCSSVAHALRPAAARRLCVCGLLYAHTHVCAPVRAHTRTHTHSLV
jgi:hypothetical protein